MSIDTIIRQHSEDVATTWWLRMQTDRSPDTQWEWLLEIDTRISANLDGLMESVSSSITLLHDQYSSALKRGATDAPADEFAALLLDAERLSPLQFLESAQFQPQSLALESLFGWSTSPAVIHAIQNASLDASSPYYEAAIKNLHCHDLCSKPALHRLVLEQAASDGVEFQAVADCGRTELVDIVIQRLRSESQGNSLSAQFLLARCALILGDGKYSRSVLENLVIGGSTYSTSACYWLCLSSSRQELNLLYKNLRKNAETVLEIQCIGWAGDVRHVPFLIDRILGDFMNVAVNAIALIFGDRPFKDMTETTEMITQQNTVDRISLNRHLSQWWYANQQFFDFNKSYIAGKILAPQCLVDTLVQGQKRHRDLAADRLKLMYPDQPRFPVQANVKIQLMHHLALCRYLGTLTQSE